MSGKKVAPAPLSRGRTEQAESTLKHPMIEPVTRSDERKGIAKQPSTFIKWPRGVRVQRQRAILKKRIKIPPTINQFSRCLDKNLATQSLALFSKYKPETKAEKQQRLLGQAQSVVDSKELKNAPKPITIKHGLNSLTSLIEQKKPKLVLIAHDVEPIELVVWLPSLCRKMGVPYAIIKSKSRLGHLVHTKNTAAVALTDVKAEHKAELANLLHAIKLNYTDKNEELRKQWGGGIRSAKSEAKMAAREEAARKIAEARAI